MTKKIDIASGINLGKALADSGLLPENCRRIIIDIFCDELVKIYYETFADKEIIDIVIDEIVKIKTGENNE